MMTNKEFIMNPSWCVCAGQDSWKRYNCGKKNKDGSASCHLIFSKKYPNVRFCVVKNESKFEIRDPWQAGGFGTGESVHYAYSVMQHVFGQHTVNQIACLNAVKEVITAE